MSKTPRPDPTSTSEPLSGPLALLRALAGMFHMKKVVILMLCLVVAEGAVRVLRPALAGQVYSAVVTGGHPLMITPDGMRVAPDMPRAPRDITVLALGDSTTYGTGVAAGETWPLQLGTRLGGTVEVQNAGFEGSEPREYLLGIKTVWNGEPQPGVILLLVTANMISFSDYRWNEPARDPRKRILRLDGDPGNPIGHMVQSSALLKLFTLHVDFAKYGLGLLTHEVRLVRPRSPFLPFGWVQPSLEDDLQPIMWDRFEESLGALNSYITEQGGCLVIGFLPPRYAISDNRLDNLTFVPKARFSVDPEQRIKQMAQSLNAPYVPSTQALRDTRAGTSAFTQPLYIPGDDTHLDAQGHGVVAESFEAVVAPLLQGTRACDFVSR